MNLTLLTYSFTLLCKSMYFDFNVILLNNYSNGVLMYIDKLRNYKKDRKKLEKISSDKMKDGIDLFANKKDKYFLIEVIMNTYSKCLKNTKVTSYCSYISVDETMIYTGVRTGYRIHIPSKPAGQSIVFYWSISATCKIRNLQTLSYNCHYNCHCT